MIASLRERIGLATALSCHADQRAHRGLEDDGGARPGGGTARGKFHPTANDAQLRPERAPASRMGWVRCLMLHCTPSACPQAMTHSIAHLLRISALSFAVAGCSSDAE